MSPRRDAQRRRGRVRDDLVAEVEALMREVEASLAIRMGMADPLETARTPLLTELFSWFLVLVLDRWVDGAEVTPADEHRARLMGIHLAQAEIPVERIERLWGLAPCGVVEEIARGGVDRLETSDYVALADLLLGNAGRLGQVAAISQRAETARLTQGLSTAQARVLSELVAGDQFSSTTIAERLTAIGLELPAQPVVLAVVTDLDMLTPPGRPELEEVLGRGLDGADATLVPDAPGVVLAPEAALPQLAALIEERRWWAAASRVHAWADFTHELEACHAALRNAPRWAFLDRAVLQDSDVVAVEAIHASSGERSAQLAAAVLGPLLDEDQAELLAALEAHLALGSAPLAARSLGIHPHTLRRRLALARELTGRDVQSNWDRFVLSLATAAAAEQG